MKNVILPLALAALFCAGCETRRGVVYERPPRREVVVMEGPPPLRREAIGPAPSRNHVWVPGFWSWDGRRYAWVAGHYEARPHRRAIYVAPRWEKQSRGWVYYEGYWR